MVLLDDVLFSLGLSFDSGISFPALSRIEP